MKKRIITSVCTLIVVPSMFTTMELQAAIYKCVKENSDVFYNDKPCPINDKESQIKSVKDPEEGYIPPKFVADEEAEGSNGVVVGSLSEKSISKDTNDVGDDDTKKGNNNIEALNKDSVINSETSSTNETNVSRVTPKKQSSGNSSDNKGSSNYPVKNVTPHEGYYKTES